MSGKRQRERRAHATSYDEQPYVRKLRALLAAGDGPLLGTVAVLDVAHDSWCPLLLGTGPCQCSPDLSYRYLPSALPGGPRDH